MGRKNEASLAAEREEAAQRETAQLGKPLGSMPESEEDRLRQRALDVKEARERTKRAKTQRDKGVAPPPVEESEDIIEEEEAPLKKAKMSRGKEVAVERDTGKKPTESELFAHLKNGVAWPATRFNDVKMMEELQMEDDIKLMLEHMNMQSFYSMAYPTYKEVSCQFLSSLEATFHSSKHVKQGWGRIKFKVNGRVYSMGFKDIGEVLGLKDLKESSIPTLAATSKEEKLTNLVWKLLAGKDRKASRDKNASIRHPTVRYLHRLIVHTIFPRKEPSNVPDEDLEFLHQTVQHFASPPQLPPVSTDFYKNFGMVGFFVKRLMYYKDWAWTTPDSDPQIGIGGLITPLLEHKGIDLGNDATGPSFLDGNYLKKAQYFSGRFNGICVYSYLQSTKTVEVLLPNWELTSLTEPGAISFDIGEEHFLGSHGPLGPMSSPKKKKSADKCNVFQPDHTSKNKEFLFGPPRYHFEQRTCALADGPLRHAHEHIGNLQRWNKAQDRTIFKLKNKCKELSKTVKRQAEVSARFMRKVTDILTGGAVAGCTAEDFGDIFAPQPQPPHDPLAPSFPLTKKQFIRQKRNPPALSSTSGNKSPSLASTDEEENSEGEASASSHAP